MMICAEPDNLTVGEFITVGSVVAVFYLSGANREQTRGKTCNSCLYNLNYVNVLHYSNKKQEDPTVFTKNSTNLEASVCRLELPEVRVIVRYFHLNLWWRILRL